MKSVNEQNLMDKLMRYTFSELSAKEEREVDEYLDENPEAAELAHGMLDYCRHEGINDRETLKRKLAAEQASYLRRIRGNQGRWKWLLWLSLFTMLALLAWRIWKNHTDPYARYPAIAAFYEQEYPRLVTAGAGDSLVTWEKAFLEQDFDRAVLLLEEELAQRPMAEAPRQLFYLCALYAYQDPPATERLQWLIPQLTSPDYQEELLDELERAGVDWPPSGE